MSYNTDINYISTDFDGDYLPSNIELNNVNYNGLENNSCDIVENPLNYTTETIL